MRWGINDSYCIVKDIRSSLMSIDRSLKVKGALSRHRNVLTREERIKVLKTEERWEDGDKVTGLPKVGHRK